MKHYIKVDSFAFDECNGILNLKLYFDIQFGQNEEQGLNGWYSDLQFKRVAIDTQETFICSNDPSELATIFTPNKQDVGELFDETYYYINSGGELVKSARRCWNLLIDLKSTSLTGALCSLTDFKESLLFFFVEVEGEYPDSIQSCMNIPKEIMFTLYDKDALEDTVFESMAMVKDLSCCTDFDTSSSINILYLLAFESAIGANKWLDAIRFWNLIHSQIVEIKKCNCS